MTIKELNITMIFSKKNFLRIFKHASISIFAARLKKDPFDIWIHLISDQNKQSENLEILFEFYFGKIHEIFHENIQFKDHYEYLFLKEGFAVEYENEMGDESIRNVYIKAAKLIFYTPTKVVYDIDDYTQEFQTLNL